MRVPSAALLCLLATPKRLAAQTTAEPAPAPTPPPEPTPPLLLPEFEPCRSSGFPLDISTWSWDVDGVRPCLDSFKIDLNSMMLTIENLLFGITTCYAFTTVVTDTAASAQKNKCGLQVHDITVDLYAELSFLWAEFVEAPARNIPDLKDPTGMSAQQILEALERPTNVSFLEFHSRINKVFSKLHDAHTRYSIISFLSPFNQVLPLEFSLEAVPAEGACKVGDIVTCPGTNNVCGGDQCCPGFVGSGGGTFPCPSANSNYSLCANATKILDCTTLESLQVLARHLDPEAARHLRKVSLINGRPPLEFLQALADRRGLYSGAAQRLNALLLGDALGDRQAERGLTLSVGGDSSLFEPGSTSVHVSFADGSEVLTKWRVEFSPIFVVLDLANLLPNKDYVTLQHMESSKAALRMQQLEECKIIPGCSERSAKGWVPEAHVDPHALRAYRRLFGDWLTATMLSDIAELGASAAKARMEQPTTASTRADQLLAPQTVPSGARNGELERAAGGGSGGPRLRGALSTPAEPLAEGEEEEAGVGSNASNTSNVSWLIEDRTRIRDCLANHSSLAPGGELEVLYAPATFSGDSEGLVVFGMEDMVVIKIITMGLSLDDLGAAMEAYKRAVDFGRQRGVRRLLIDLVSNAGGLVLLSDMMQSLLLKNYDAADICLDYNKKVNEYWRQWILSYGAGIDMAIETFVDTVKQRVARTPLRILKWLTQWHLEHLRIIMNTSNTILDPLIELGECGGTFDLDKIDRWLQRLETIQASGDLVGFIERVMRRQEFVPDCLYVMDAPGNRYDRSGWYPFPGNEILERSTLRPFPNLSGLLQPVRQRWGDGRDVGQRYSQRGPFASCPFSIGSLANLQRFAEDGLPDLRQHRDHPFTDIAVLTDGLSGSAGSSLPTKLMASGYVTVFTYGGNGEVMDSSSFAGGNVVEYDSLWRQTAVAAELGMWLVPGSPWETLSKQVGLTSDVTGGEAVIYPRPMPLLLLQVSYNFNMMYVPEFDVEGDHTQLPRQFYSLPAHRHYSSWPRRLRHTCDNPQGLLGMYARIQREDWWRVRSSPQYLNRGWSSACVPDASREECCAVREAPEAQDEL